MLAIMKTRTFFRRTLMLAMCSHLALYAAQGQQWQRVEALPAVPMTALYALGDTLFAAGPNKIYRSDDAGITWDSSAVINPALDYITAMRRDQGRLYVSTIDQGVYSSGNGGQNWQADNNGLNGLGATHLSSLAIRGDSLYAGSYGAGVYVKKISTNSNWSAYNSGMPWFNVESVTNIGGQLFAGAGGNGTYAHQTSPANPWTEKTFAVFNGLPNSLLAIIRHGDVLLGAGTLGFYRSTDEGDTWSPYNPGTGILGSARLVVHGNRVIANLAKPAAFSFLQYSDDQGLSWQHFEPAITGSFGYDLAVCDGQLFSARDNGLWRIALTTGMEEPLEIRPELGQNFPNPFSGSTTIPFVLHRQGPVELTVLDVSGRPVRVLLLGEKNAGAHEIGFESGGLPPGIYVCRLTTDAGTSTRLISIHK
jgi:photosystem II stability/assembly factor-like uncharacterized protein